MRMADAQSPAQPTLERGQVWYPRNGERDRQIDQITCAGIGDKHPMGTILVCWVSAGPTHGWCAERSFKQWIKRTGATRMAEPDEEAADDAEAFDRQIAVLKAEAAALELRASEIRSRIAAQSAIEAAKRGLAAMVSVCVVVSPLSRTPRVPRRESKD